MMSLSDYKQTDIIDAFNTISSYLDDLLNNNYTDPHFQRKTFQECNFN